MRNLSSKFEWRFSLEASVSQDLVHKITQGPDMPKSFFRQMKKS